MELLNELKSHVLLLEHGLMLTMTSDQKSNFLDKRNLLFPPPLDENPSQIKESRTDPTLEAQEVTESPTPQRDPSSSEKGKEPVGVEEEEEEEEEEDGGEETEEEDDTAYKLIRRRPGTRSTFTL